MSDHSSVNIYVCRDFNVHKVEWLVHSNKTDDERRFFHEFSLTYDLTWIVDKPSWVPDTDGQFASLLDLFPTICSELLLSFLSAGIFWSLGCFNEDKKSIKKPQISFTIGWCISARWLTGTVSECSYPNYPMLYVLKECILYNIQLNWLVNHQRRQLHTLQEISTETKHLAMIHPWMGCCHYT